MGKRCSREKTKTKNKTKMLAILVLMHKTIQLRIRKTTVDRSRNHGKTLQPSKRETRRKKKRKKVGLSRTDGENAADAALPSTPCSRNAPFPRDLSPMHPAARSQSDLFRFLMGRKPLFAWTFSCGIRSADLRKSIIMRLHQRLRMSSYHASVIYHSFINTPCFVGLFRALRNWAARS